MEKKNNMKRSKGAVILEFMQSIALAMAVFVAIYWKVAQPNEVKGSSMLPNFTNGEFLLTDKLTYAFSDPKRGDVVVFRAPPSEPCAEDSCEYIKRIIGLPGDRVMVKNGRVYLNGQLLEEDYLDAGIRTSPGNFSQEGVERVVPEGYYLCFGDNRPHSRDGREFGPVAKDAIVGRAFFKYWPVSSVGIVSKTAAK